jgi:predicted dithiol-disulfide oxidoreductase (DUF899 family)
MALLKSVKDIPGIDYYEYRDKEFYNKYDYRMRVKIPCVRYTYTCKQSVDLDRKIAGKFKGYGNIRKEDLKTVVDNVSALKAIIDLQSSRKDKNIGLRIESSTVALFSNDLQALHDLKSTIGLQYQYNVTQAQTSEYAGIKEFVNEPKHKFRVYLKSKRVSDTFVTELSQLFARTPNLHPSNALIQWISPKQRYAWKQRYSSASYFIDYDDESTLSYLALLYGEMLGKKYKLEKRADPV